MPGAETLGAVVTVRVAEGERDALESCARALGVSKSEYVRALLALPVEVAFTEEGLVRAEGAGTLIVYDRHTFRELHKQLRAWGYHYNQALHALNKVASRRYMSAGDTVRLVARARDLLEDIDSYRARIDSLLARVESAELARIRAGRR